MVARRRDERRPTGRRRLREVAAIATALLVVPIAAILGLKLPLDAAGVLAPIFDLPRTAFGHVRSASEGPVELSARPADGVATATDETQAFAPPRLHRQRPAHVVEPTPVDREPTPANVGATQRPSHETPETSKTPRSGPPPDHDTHGGSGTGSPGDPPGNAFDRPGGPAAVDRPSVKPSVGGPSTPPGGGDSAEGPLPPTGDEPVHEPTGPADDQVGGTTDAPSAPPLPGGTSEPDGAPSDPGAPEDEPETLSTDSGQAPGTGEEVENEPPMGSTDQPADDETGPVGDEAEPPGETGDATGEPGEPGDSTEADDAGSTPDDPPPGLEDEDEGEQPPAGDEGVGDETSGDPADDDQGNTEDDGNGNGHGNGNGNGNGKDGCYGSGQGHANGNGNGNCPGQGVANGHDPNHHSAAGQSAVLASPLLLFALAGCTGRVRPRGRRAA